MMTLEEFVCRLMRPAATEAAVLASGEAAPVAKPKVVKSQSGSTHGTSAHDAEGLT